VLPRNPTEAKLQAIWSEVLGRQDVGVTDNLYEIGGHSLITIQIIARVNEVFHVKIEINYFFLNPTIEGIASRIDAIRWANQSGEGEVAPHSSEITI
jgi:acyl carrier protein